MAASSQLKTRIKNIQRHLGLSADGIIGPMTLSKIEQALKIKQAYSLKVSKQGLRAIIKHEISSKAYYEKRLTKACWPGGNSGVTIGIGYDLGCATKTRIKADLQGLVSDDTLNQLIKAAGKRGTKAKTLCTAICRKNIKVTYAAAEKLFYTRTLPDYAKQTRRIYPGIEKLPADVQSMLLSLIYNRGSKLTGARRREMHAIKKHVKNQDLAAIAKEFQSMKRLWQDKGLEGLLHRRDSEARMIKKSKRVYKESDIAYI